MVNNYDLVSYSTWYMLLGRNRSGGGDLASEDEDEDEAPVQNAKAEADAGRLETACKDPQQRAVKTKLIAELIPSGL